MIRLLGVLLIFSACCSVGLNLSLTMKKKLERLNIFRRMADEISTLIRYRSLTVREIIELLKSNDAYGEITFLHTGDFNDKSRPVGEIWVESVMSDFSLSSEEKKLISQLGTQLGTTDTQGQLSVIAVFNEGIGKMLEKQSEKYAVKGKLYRSMGILAGAMAGILII